MNDAPKKIWAAPHTKKGWAEANAGDWPSPLNPGDTPYIRADHVDVLLRDTERKVRAENERLRRAMRAAQQFCDAGAAPTAALVLSDALREPHSAVEPFSGVTPSDDD